MTASATEVEATLSLLANQPHFSIRQSDDDDVRKKQCLQIEMAERERRIKGQGDDNLLLYILLYNATTVTIIVIAIYC